MTYKNIYRLYAVRLIASFSFIGGILVPFYTVWADMEESIVPIIQLWFMFWAAVLEVPTGTVADYVSRKVSIVLGLLLVGIGFVTYVVRPELTFFLLGEFIIAVGVALISGADESLLYDSLIELGMEQKATQVSSRYGMFGMVGLLVGAPIGSIVAVKFGYEYAFIFTGITNMIGMIVALTLKEPTVHKKDIIEGTDYISTLMTGVSLLLRHSNVKRLGFDLAMVHALSATIIWMNQMALSAVLIPVAWFGFVASSGILIEIVVANIISPLENRYGVECIARVTTLWSGAGLLLVGIGIISQSQWMVLIGIVPPFSILIGRKSMMRAHINHHISSGQRATVLSAVELLRKGITALSYVIMSVGLLWSSAVPLLIFSALLVLMSIYSPIYQKVD